MAKIIKERERKSKTEYELNFYTKDTNEICLGFPIVNGEVKPYKEGMKNYLEAKENPNLYSVIKERVTRWTEPAVAVCECGKEISLNYDAEECPYCGRLHNLFGQELLPRHMWEEPYYEEDYY